MRHWRSAFSGRKPSALLSPHFRRRDNLMSDDKVRRLHPEQSDIDAAIAELNESYAVVLVGGKASILREPETAQERESWTLMPISSFHVWFANKKIQLNDKAMPLSKVWMSYPRRRQYEAIVFAPGRDDP